MEAFPSVRLLYDLPLRGELWANQGRLDALESIRFHRVIDNAELTMSAKLLDPAQLPIDSSGRFSACRQLVSQCE